MMMLTHALLGALIELVRFATLYHSPGQQLKMCVEPSKPHPERQKSDKFIEFYYNFHTML